MLKDRVWTWTRPKPRPTCRRCCRNPVIGKGWRNGFRIWRTLCSLCYKKRHRTAMKESICSRCGFVPEESCQLDIDHADGNRKNNDHANLITLCANCHRLKSWRDKNYLTRY